jgi:NhaA family Na+:H+ antiporter
MSVHKRAVLRLSGFVLDYLLALPLGCAAALVWANSLPESYYRFAHATTFAVNDVGVAFFFALITKEVAEATLPGGALHPWRRAALPVVAAVGSVVVSMACYLLFVRHVGEYMLESGWVAACAIDIPGSYVIARMIFGRHPAIPFLLLLAIAADAIGLACVAVLHPVSDAHPAVGIGLMAVAVGMAAALRYGRVKSFWWYLLGPGLVSWWALFLGGVHPALALVPIVPFFPHGKRDQGLFVDAAPHAHDTLTRFERWWRLPVEGVLLLFGLVNAGVPLHGLEAGTWAIPIAAIARPIGIVAATGVGLAAGLHLPQRVGDRDLVVVGCTASIALVFALFFAGAVMPPGPILLEMKMGALLTIFGGVLAFAAARLLRVGRFARGSSRDLRPSLRVIAKTDSHDM